jgi:ribosomal protein L12E/L44/L45/RPP1/RPP2
MKKAAVGFSVHSGWTALVVVSVEKGMPKVLQRERLQLVKTFSFKFRQPYHTAEKMRLEDAEKFVLGVRKEAEELAYRALRDAQVGLEKEGYRLERGGLLLAAGRALPELEKILMSHALIHSADGELFREVIREACERCGVQVKCVKAKELLKECGGEFSIGAAELLWRVTEMGKAFGAPWSQDEKFATLVAWLADAGRRASATHKVESKN